MTFDSLFAGIGGFDLGFERAGMRARYQVEKDARCRAVLARRFPGATIVNDVREFTPSEPADVVCGGFPCTDVSVVGRRAGLAGEQSGLWFEFLRVVRVSRPRTVVIENTRGLLSSHGGRDMDTIVSGLEELGYWWAYRTLDAQHFGLAQQRHRVFIVASLDPGTPARALFDGTPDELLPTPKRGNEVAGCLVARSPSRWCRPSNLIGECDGVRFFSIEECVKLQGFPDGWVDGESNAAAYRMLGNAVPPPMAKWLGERLVATAGEGELVRK